jgi:putative restriction endonuclease
MNHGDITKRVSKQTGVRPAIVEDVITALFAAVIEVLEKPQSVGALPFDATPHQAKSEVSAGIRTVNMRP